MSNHLFYKEYFDNKFYSQIMLFGMGGGRIQKMTFDDKEGVGVGEGLKKDDVIYK